jgi:hypothetical protein
MDGENSAVTVVFFGEQQQELLFFNGFAKGFGEGSKLILKFFVIGLRKYLGENLELLDPVVHLVPLVKPPVDPCDVSRYGVTVLTAPEIRNSGVFLELYLRFSEGIRVKDCPAGPVSGPEVPPES